MRLSREAVRIELVTPFPEWALPQAWQWVQPALRLMADDFALQNTQALIDAAASMESRGGRTWGVLRNGRLCGWLGFEPVNKISGVGHCFFAPWAWGRETTDRAVRLCLEEIWAMGYERVSCPVLAHNRSIRGLMKRVGIREEGTLRSFTMSGGKTADLVMAGSVKADYGDHDSVGGTARGTEQYDSISDGNDQQRGNDQRVEHADVFADPKWAAGDHSRSAPELHYEGAESHAGDDDRNGQPKHDLQGDRRSPGAKSRKSRVRKLGSEWDGGSPNRSRKSRSGRKSAIAARSRSTAAAAPGPPVSDGL
jgi:RimJ/RimL family protein N-acetyltransferase